MTQQEETLLGKQMKAMALDEGHVRRMPPDMRGGIKAEVARQGLELMRSAPVIGIVKHSKKTGMSQGMVKYHLKRVIDRGLMTCISGRKTPAVYETTKLGMDHLAELGE